MSETRSCRRCGADVEAKALFCSRCGQDMTLVGDQEDTLAVTTAGTPVEPVRSTMRQALRDATLGEYEVLSELGRGGMATVFLAHDIALDRKVAIKVMAPHLLEGEGMAERFKLEARTAAQLSHPHIIPIYAVKETAETLFFVMKYVEGRGLDAVIKKTGPLPIPMVKDILTKVGSALGYAHRRDVVHRDIKPGNVMIDEEGTPIVTDFGIAKVTEAKGLTVTGTTIGTPSYMSPEQCEAKEVTGASDQYSLGIVAFEMLTAKLPFEGDSAVTTMYKHCHEPLPPLEDFRPDCPPELRETIERMVAKDPADRWPSLEAAVRKLNNEPTPTQVDPIRSHLMELVKEGDADELLARLSDPSGPVTRRTDPRASRRTATATGPRRGVVAGIVAVAALSIGAALVVTQPWAQGGAAAPTAAAGPVAAEPPPTRPTDTNDPAGSDEGGGAATSDIGPRGDVGGADAPASPDPPSGGGTALPASDGAAAAADATAPPARATVSTVEIADAPDELQQGQTARLTATPLDASGDPVPAAGVVWTSSNEGVASVDAGGSVRAVAPGRAVLTAAAGGHSGSVTLRVTEATVASLRLDRADLEMTVGDQASISAEPRDGGGAPLDRAVSWSTSDASIVTADGGRVTARGPGTATVTATSDGASATADVTVRLPTRNAVEALVEAYAGALESRDVAQVRRVYPAITDEQASTLETTLADMDGLRVDTSIESVDERGETAVANVAATYRFRGGGRDQNANVILVFTFARTPTGWRIRTIQSR